MVQVSNLYKGVPEPLAIRVYPVYDIIVEKARSRPKCNEGVTFQENIDVPIDYC